MLPSARTLQHCSSPHPVPRNPNPAPNGTLRPHQYAFGSCAPVSVPGAAPARGRSLRPRPPVFFHV
eukprot:2398371-Rhodomonas_salina.2